MLNYLQKFLPSLSNKLKAIRDILKGSFDQSAIDDCWAQMKDDLRHAATTSFTFYDCNANTAVLSDASPHGLGAVLMQFHENEWKPVLCASRSLTSTEQKYSQMERELLSIVFGASRFRQFILGGPVQFWTDHKPLESIWKKPFDDVAPRLQRMLMRLAPFGGTICYKPAREPMNTLADVLSRSPVADDTTELCTEDYCEIASVVLDDATQFLTPDFVSVKEVARETAASNSLSLVIDCLETSNWSKLPEHLDIYFKERYSLSVSSQPRLLLRGTQIVIPSTLRERVIHSAHDSHVGLKSTLANLSSVWWPGLTKEVRSIIEHCEHCKEFDERWPHTELKPSDELPPWHTSAIDIFHVDGKPFVSIVDYGSRYPDIGKISLQYTIYDCKVGCTDGYN